jgi:hypothetical protein
MLLRWCYVQLDQRHTAVSAYGPTRRQARTAIGEVLKALGGDLFARAPKTMTEDPDWLEVLHAVGAIGDHEERLALAAWLVEVEIEERDDVSREAVERWLTAARSLAASMVKEINACDAGWIPGKGWPGQKKPRRRRRRR